MDQSAKDEIRELFAGAIGSLPHNAPDLIGRGWERAGDLWSAPPTGLPGVEVDSENLGHRLRAILERTHSDHCGWVGLAGVNGSPMAPESVVFRGVHEVLTRMRRGLSSTQALEQILNELERFIDSTETPVSFVVPLDNFSMDADRIALSGASFELRKMTDDEAGRFFGHGLNPFGPFSGMLPPAYAVIGTVMAPKELGEYRPGPGAAEPVEELVRRLLVALRTFKRGAPYEEGIHFSVLPFTLMNASINSWGRAYGRPAAGPYHLRADEIGAFERHSALVAQPLHRSLAYACQRLADAQMRSDRRDMLVDAVTGLEAILLPRRNRTELSYRFRLHYAAIIPGGHGVGRIEAYRQAQDVYAMRSTIVHGDEVDHGELFRLSDGATDMLRFALKRFLPGGLRPDYLEHGFWEELLLASSARQLA